MAITPFEAKTKKSYLMENMIDNALRCSFHSGEITIVLFDKKVEIFDKEALVEKYKKLGWSKVEIKHVKVKSRKRVGEKMEEVEHEETVIYFKE